MKDYFTEGSSGACSWGMGSKQHMGVSKATQRHRSSGWNLSPELILKFSESFERDLVISPWQKRCNNRNHWIWTSKLLFAKFSIEFSRIHPEITCSAFPYRRCKLNEGSRPRPRPRFRRCKACTGSGGSSAVRHEKALAKPSFNLSSPIQPYQAVCEYLRLRISQAKFPLEPLFLDHAVNPVSRTWFQKQLKSVLLSAGISATNFSSHSFRIGAATSAAQKGLTKTPNPNLR